jgi:Tetracyclin repressor-like, C-terminal domain
VPRRGPALRLERVYGAYLKEILRQGVKQGQVDIENVSFTALTIHTMCEYASVW